jgi:hypothetical protein
MTDDERGEYDLLRVANELGKLAVAGNPEPGFAAALARLQGRGWVGLIDVTTLNHLGPAYKNIIFKIYQATPEALAWMRQVS